MLTCSIRIRKFLKVGLLVLPLFAIAFFSGCARHDFPTHNYIDGQTEQFKRMPLRDHVDYIYNWNSRIYHAPRRSFEKRLTQEQAKKVAELGHPEYVREKFRSRLGESVLEWAYLEQNQVVQFIDGQLVFQGPLTDRDMVLIQQGLPRFTFRNQEEMGPLMERYVYRKTDIPGRQRVFTFADGKLSSASW